MKRKTFDFEADEVGPDGIFMLRSEKGFFKCLSISREDLREIIPSLPEDLQELKVTFDFQGRERGQGIRSQGCKN